MRFMLLVKATPESEAGILPDEKLITAMGKFNEELANAGVLLALEGLQSSSKGARVGGDAHEAEVATARSVVVGSGRKCQRRPTTPRERWSASAYASLHTTDRSS